MTATAQEIIEKLKLEPHPEGGFYRQMFTDNSRDVRATSTAIYYLLAKGDRSHWHRVDAAEVWHYYAGAPLHLSMSLDGHWEEHLMLGPDVLGDQVPQIVVPALCWQSARTEGDWTLVGCTVAPGFEFSGFEMAPPDWAPGKS